MASGKSKRADRLFKRARQRQRKRMATLHTEVEQKLQAALALDIKVTPDEKSLLEITYSVTRDPLPDSWSSLLSPEDREEMNRAHEILLSAPRRAMPFYERLAAKYPDNPSIYNNLLVARGVDGPEVIQSQLERFPNYLFAKTNYGHFLLRENRPAEVLEAFEHKLKLDIIYPDRTLFHISEHLAFWGLLAAYFLKIGRFSLAFEFYLALLEWEEDYPDKIGLTYDIRNHPLMTLLVEKLAKELPARRQPDSGITARFYEAEEKVSHTKGPACKTEINPG
jgi:tetratricopeptide (TPR) repeat protein